MLVEGKHWIFKSFSIKIYPYIMRIYCPLFSVISKLHEATTQSFSITFSFVFSFSFLQSYVHCTLPIQGSATLGMSKSSQLFRLMLSYIFYYFNRWLFLRKTKNTLVSLDSFYRVIMK